MQRRNRNREHDCVGLIGEVFRARFMVLRELQYVLLVRLLPQETNERLQMCVPPVLSQLVEQRQDPESPFLQRSVCVGQRTLETRTQVAGLRMA